MGAVTDDLLLVTSEGCHLCEHARTTLANLGLEARELGVDSDEARRLATQGVPLAFLPVLLDGTRVVAYGRLSERRLRKDLGL
jgi:glutaredoxin